MKNLLSLLFFFFMLNAVSYSQDSAIIRFQRHPLPTLPTLPVFIGGKDSLATFIKRNTHYPEEARKHHISGAIEVDFTVTKDGTIKNPTVLKPLGYGCDEEALRVVHLMPQWIPSRSGLNPMELNYHVTIPFGKQPQIIKKT